MCAGMDSVLGDERVLVENFIIIPLILLAYTLLAVRQSSFVFLQY